jgi:acetoin utilization deacetylase AcuC-like enzyme
VTEPTRSPRQELSVVWSPEYEVDIGPHVFPTRKYRLTRERLLGEGTLRESSFLLSEPASEEEIGLVHTPEYVRKIRSCDFEPWEILRMEVPFNPEIRDASFLCAGGTILTGHRALEEGVAVHLGGGFHHAFADHGEGFCIINDVAVAARVLLSQGAAERIVVVDLDVHQGNGTAHIFARDLNVFTLSVHQENNYPTPKPPSHLDLGLPDGTGDEAYLAVLKRHLPQVLEDHEPDLVLYLAGADPYREDQLGGLDLTISGLRARDELVMGEATSRGIGVGVLLAGGYALRPDHTVEIHCGTVRAAAALAES